MISFVTSMVTCRGRGTCSICILYRGPNAAQPIAYSVLVPQQAIILA